MSDFNPLNSPSMGATDVASGDFLAVVHVRANGTGVDGKMSLAALVAYLSANTFSSLSVSGMLTAAAQQVASTGNVNVTSSNVVCTGSTTAPQLPAVANGLVVSVKNMGSGNCVITGTGSAPIVPLASVSTGATTITLATNTQGIFFCDGTNWYRTA